MSQSHVWICEHCGCYFNKDRAEIHSCSGRLIRYRLTPDPKPDMAMLNAFAKFMSGENRGLPDEVRSLLDKTFRAGWRAAKESK